MKVTRYAVMTGYAGCGGCACDILGLFKTKEEAIRRLHEAGDEISDYYEGYEQPEDDSYEEYDFWDTDDESFGNIQIVEIEVDPAEIGGKEK